MVSRKSVINILAVSLIILTGGFLRHYYNQASSDRFVVRGDSAAYITYASNLLDHGVYSKDRLNKPPIPDAFWAPGYPGFLAASIKLSQLFGSAPPRFILSAQLFLGLLTILLTYLLGREYLPGMWPLFPAALVALSPHLVAIGQNILTETLFGMLLILTIYLFVLGVDRNRKLLLLLAGFAMAASWLVNPVSLLVAPILCLSTLLGSSAAKQSTGFLLLLTGRLFLIPLLLVIMAWSARTSFVVQEGGLKSSDRLLTNLIIGMHSDFHERWRADPSDPTNPATLDELAIGGSYAKFARVFADRTTEQPVAMLTWYLLNKPVQLWGWDVQVGYRDIYIFPVEKPLYETSRPAIASYVLMKSSHSILLLFAAMGIICLGIGGQRKKWIPAAIYLVTIYICLVYIATQADPRYSFPLRPELYLCATYFLASLVDFVRNRGKSEDTQGSA